MVQSKDETNYIYLLQEREFIKTDENIYKIGKTKQTNNKRFNSYPKGSILLFQVICEDCDLMEIELIKLFDINFEKCKQIGNEYFKGSYYKMIDLIYNIVKLPVFEKSLLEIVKDKLESKKNISTKCKFCLNIFSNNRYLKIHEKNCKQCDDPIRLLEIEQDICPILPDSKTCCRFCDKDLYRIDNLNRHILICKEREEYHQTLLTKLKKDF